ncbi:MAG: threo-3-hydroxy-L-aspartate ammonia-lyase [Pararhizobium sp.]
MQQIPTYDDIAAAAERIAGVARVTPVMTSRLADEMLGCKLFFKCENFQRTGAFKFRGAYNALSGFDAAQRRHGVVTFSSGNHAQAIARAAALLGIAATIVMPQDAPTSKLAATRAYGASIVTYDRYTEDRDAIGRAMAEEKGMTLIPPYDHPDIVAGQGTTAKELFEEVGALDVLFVCLGGGGLLAGSLLSAGALSPDCAVYGVEPEAGDDGRRSLDAGHIIRIEPPKTIADGAQTLSLGRITFEIIRRRAAGILAVSDADLVECMRFFASRMKMIVEPTGCLGFAGARRATADLEGKRVGVIVSGGNVDLSRFAALAG